VLPKKKKASKARGSPKVAPKQMTDADLLNQVSKEELWKRLQQKRIQSAYNSLGFPGNIF
jgi:hypothetical protein